MSTDKYKSDTNKAREIQSPTVSESVPDNYYDQRYIDAYCENPKEGKKAALLKAGYAGDYAAQEAYRIHKRVQHLIDLRVNETKHNLATLALKQLTDILGKDVSEVGSASMLTAIKQGLDYSGHKPSDKLEVTEKTLSFEEMEAELKELERQEAEQRTH